MLEKSHYYEIDNFDQENMQEMLETILHENLDYKTRSVRLGRSLIKINYYDPNVAYNLQTENKILILQDPKKTCHINFQGKIGPAQISNVWDELKKNISPVSFINEQENISLTRERFIYEIIERLESRQIKANTFEILESIGKFQQEYQRLPYKNEIDLVIDKYLVGIKVELEDIIKQDPIRDEKIKVIPEIEDNKLSSTTPKGSSGDIISISKPVGRRTCPHCGNVSSYKIIEKIDKNYILCVYPRLYGKIYHCDGCRGRWREQ